MRNKQSLITFILFALFLGASYFAKKSQLTEEQSSNQKMAKAPSLLKKPESPVILVEEKQESTPTLEQNSESLSQKRDIEAILKTKKKKSRPTPSRKIAQFDEAKQKIAVNNHQFELLLDYATCIENCPEGNLISSIHDLKIIAPNEQSSLQTQNQLGYAIREMANPHVIGFWNKQIFISTNGKNPQIQNELENFNFTKIDSPFQNSYVVKYDQDVNKLNKTIDQIKKLNSVISVNLELVTQPVQIK